MNLINKNTEQMNPTPVNAAIPNTVERVTGAGSAREAQSLQMENANNSVGATFSKEKKVVFALGGVFGMWVSCGAFCLFSYIVFHTTTAAAIMAAITVAAGAYIAWSMAAKIIRRKNADRS